MKKAFIASLCSLLCISISAYSQSTVKNKGTLASHTGKNLKPFPSKWTAKPFNDQVFIENKGQFDGKINSGEKILYGVKLGSIEIYFTKDKVVYRYDKPNFEKPTEPDASKADKAKISFKTYMLNAEWQNSNKDVSIETKDEQKNYYTYPSGLNKGIKASLYKQIIYKDLYPGVDAI